MKKHTIPTYKSSIEFVKEKLEFISNSPNPEGECTLKYNEDYIDIIKSSDMGIMDVIRYQNKDRLGIFRFDELLLFSRIQNAIINVGEHAIHINGISYDYPLGLSSDGCRHPVFFKNGKHYLIDSNAYGLIIKSYKEKNDQIFHKLSTGFIDPLYYIIEKCINTDISDFYAYYLSEIASIKDKIGFPNLYIWNRDSFDNFMHSASDYIMMYSPIIEYARELRVKIDSGNISAEDAWKCCKNRMVYTFAKHSTIAVIAYGVIFNNKIRSEISGMKIENPILKMTKVDKDHAGGYRASNPMFDCWISHHFHILCRYHINDPYLITSDKALQIIWTSLCSKRYHLYLKKQYTPQLDILLNGSDSDHVSTIKEFDDIKTKVEILETISRQSQ